MSAHKSGGKGTYLLDRVFPGVGRIRRASGTDNTRMLDSLNQMLSTLFSLGRLDLLAALRDGDLHPMQVWARFRKGDMARLPDAQEVVPVLDRALEWAKSYPKSPKHKANLKTTFKNLRLFAPDTTFAELANSLRRYRSAMTQRPAMFNRTRAAVLAFLKDTKGRQSDVWREVANITRLEELQSKAPSVTPPELAQLLGKLSQPYPAMAWTMALTGMGPGEYWGSWSALDDRVHIHGTKTHGRDRDVPRVGVLVHPQTTEKPLRRVLRRIGLLPYSLRRSYSMWLGELDIASSAIR